MAPMFVAGAVSLDQLLTDLVARRPLFHSEKDLQVALAWQAHLSNPEIEVYLEPRPRPGVHLDLAFEDRRTGAYTAIELKYLTRSFSGEVNGQYFALANHSAHDHRRYDVLRDVERVEGFVRDRVGATGAVVVVTNDAAYVRHRGRPSSNDAMFSIDDGVVLHGVHEWQRPPAGERAAPIAIAGTYRLSWKELAEFAPGHRLWTLVIEVPETEHGSR